MREDINVKGADIELDAWLISVLCQGSRVQFPAGDLKEFYKYIYIYQNVYLSNSRIYYMHLYLQKPRFLSLSLSVRQVRLKIYIPRSG